MLRRSRSLLMSLCLASAVHAQTELLNWQGSGESSYFGSTVTGAGDMDGDGTPDVMVGAFNYEYKEYIAGADGFVAVYSGNTGATVHRYVGGFSEPFTGASIDAGGDVNGDGVPDFLFAGFFNCCKGSVVRVHDGSTGHLLYKLQGSLYAGVGNGLVGDVDIDEDGLDDFVVTSWNELHAYSGADGSELYGLYAEPGLLGFGDGLASIGDIDGDDVPELLLAVSTPPEVRVLSGATGTTVYSVTQPGAKSFGRRMANVGDLDCDGLDDFAVSAHESSGADGRVYVYSGADGTPLRELYGSHAGGGFPTGLAGVGDLNGDGTPDLAVGAYHDSELLSEAGRLTIFSGADGSVLMVLYGSEVRANLGTAVAGVGDLDGGGVPDLAVGAPGTGPLDDAPGQVFVLAGERSAGVYCTAKTSSQGCTPTIWSSGSPSLSASTFRLSGQSLINEQRGVLIWGLRAAGSPFEGGVNCVGAVQRRRVVWTGGNSGAVFPQPDCSGSVRDDWSSAYLTSEGLVPGQTVYAQFRYADPGDPHRIGLTDALRFDVLP